MIYRDIGDYKPPERIASAMRHKPPKATPKADRVKSRMIPDESSKKR